MAEKVTKCGIKREPGWLYFIDKNGNVARTKMARGQKVKGGKKQEVLVKTAIKRKEGYLYFIDKQGDVSCAKMVRRKGGSAKKKPAKKAKKK